MIANLGPSSRRCALVLLVLPLAEAAPGLPAVVSDTVTEVWLPYAPGGTSSRAAQALVLGWEACCDGKPVIVPRSGAGGALALRRFVSARADGSCLLLGSTGTQVALPLSGMALPRPAARPVACLSTVGALLVASVRLGVQRFEGLHSVGEGRSLSYASSGTGSLGHLVMAGLGARTGLPLHHLPYQGMAVALSDLLEGRVDLAMLNEGDALPLVQSGRLLPLAVSGANRLPELPAVPTLTDLGHEAVDLVHWQGIFVPPPAQTDTVLRIAALIKAAKAQAPFRDHLAAGRQRLVAADTPAGFADMIAEQTARAALLAKAAGLPAR